jgi:hypothetical protein
MKHIITSILFLVVTNCLAINQQAADSIKRHDLAMENLKKIEFEIASEHRVIKSWLEKLDKNKSSYFKSYDMEKFYQQRIKETQEKINILNSKYVEANKLVEKLQPVKKEYDKQIELEIKRDKFKTAILNVVGILGIPCIGLIAWLYFFRWIINKNKKYQQLLKEGKITQDEYDRIMSSSYEKSTLFRDDDRTNPATGLRMTGGCDSGGNPYGCSFSNSSTSETHKTKWD